MIEMGFYVYSVDDGHVLPTEYRTLEAAEYAAGAAITETGKLVGAAECPAYITVGELTADDCAGPVPVIRVDEGIIFETDKVDSGCDCTLGAGYSIDSGVGIKGAASSGCAYVVAVTTTAAGKSARVRFKKS
jgi:hypothetical protein